MRELRIGIAAIAAVLLVGCTASTPVVPPIAPVPDPAFQSAGSAAEELGGSLGETVVKATAIVEQVDLKTRHVTLRRPDGSTFTTAVGEDVRNLDQVKSGDEVVVTYYESIAYQVMKAGDAQPGAAAAVDVGRAQRGDRPAGAIAQVVTVTGTIKEINERLGMVVLQGPGEKLMPVKVRNPERLVLLSVGDLVELSYTEGVAIAVEPRSKP